MIVCSSREEFRNLAPLVSVFLVSQNDGSILFRSPFVLFDVWVQVIVPTLTALLTDSPRKCLCDVTPIFCAKFFDVCSKSFVLLLTPRPFDHGGVQHFLPPMKALDVGAMIQEGSDSLPVSSSVLLD